MNFSEVKELFWDHFGGRHSDDTEDTMICFYGGDFMSQLEEQVNSGKCQKCLKLLLQMTLLRK